MKLIMYVMSYLKYWKHMMNTKDFAKKLRLSIVKMISKGKSSHVGSALSIVDIVSVLYNDILNISPENFKDDFRDRFILSKGHAGAALYAALAYKGFISINDLDNHYKDGSKMSGHISHHINGVELSTGSLGQGSGVSAGIALSLKLRNNPSNVFCLLSDGELNEGSTWESIMFAAHHKLNNLTFIIDFNGLQSIKSTEQTISMTPLNKKFIAFNFDVMECDGNNLDELKSCLKSQKTSKPKVLIAKTIKGKGVSFMENQILWHYKTPSTEEVKLAIEEINNA